METNILSIKLRGTTGGMIDNAKITWLETRDLIGPTKEFPIKRKEGSYEVGLPGNGVYLFSINAAGYEEIIHYRIDVNDEVGNAEIIMHEK